MDKPVDPYREILDNIELIRPAKRCPQCNKFTLSYDAARGRVFCSSCGLERFLPR